MRILKYLKLAPLVLILTSCLHTNGIVPEPAKPGDRNAKSVRIILSYASEVSWHRSPYSRLEDFSWPWNVIIANDGTACALFTNIVYLPEPNAFYACPTQWRIARP